MSNRKKIVVLVLNFFVLVSIILSLVLSFCGVEDIVVMVTELLTILLLIINSIICQNELQDLEKKVKDNEDENEMR